MKITQKITALLLISAIIVSAFSFGAMSATPVKGSEVAEYARQFEGCSYQYACKGPDKFDCSGLVYYVLKNFGITFGAGTSEYNTVEKAKAFGNIISDMSDAEPGDIVAWGSHTGVYLGEGKCISAMNSRKGVVITNVESFIDRHGVKNPYHFFIRPYEYVEETAEDVENTTGETTVAPETDADTSASEKNTMNLVEFFIIFFVRMAEYLVTELFVVPTETIADFFIV